MMNEKDYLTVKEFAKEVNISVQAVYQRLNKDLKEYFKIINGKKMINVLAIELFSFKEVEQEFNDSLTNSLKDSLKLMEKQLEEKDNQIKEKDRQISNLDKRLEESQKLNANQQELLRREQEKLLMFDNNNKEGLFQRIFKKK